MFIRLDRISEEGTSLKGEEPGELLDLRGDKFLEPAGPIEYRFFVQRLTEQLVVKGDLKAPLRVKCVRCGDFFSTTARDSDFLCTYFIKPGLREVNLDQDIREAILLALSTYPLCSKDCQGLCHKCGHNLNNGKCDCKPDEWGDDPWKALDGLDL